MQTHKESKERSTKLRDTSVQFLLDMEVKERVERLPDLDMAFINTKIPRELENEHDLMSEIESQSNQQAVIPHNILKPRRELDWLIKTQVIRPNAHYDSEFISKLFRLLKYYQAEKLFDHFFWLTHFVKYQPSSLEIIQRLRNQVSIVYAAFLQILKKEEEDVKNALNVVLGYLVHTVHYKLFAKNRKKFDTRFILDCYHIVIFEMTGVLVSDFYVHSCIEKLFEDRFFFYKQEGTLLLTKVDPKLGMEFYKHFRKVKEDLNVLRMSNGFSDQDKDMIFNLFGTLNRKFSYIGKGKMTKTSLLVNRMTTELAKSLIDLAKKEDFDQIVQEKKTKMKIDAVMREKKQTAIKRLQEEVEDPKEKEFLRQAQIYVRNRLPRLKKKFKFDCSQVSPPLRNLIGGVVLPIKKKKMKISSFQVSDFGSLELAKLYEMFNGGDRDVAAEAKKRVRDLQAAKRSNLLKSNENARKMMDLVGVDNRMKLRFLDFYQVNQTLNDNNHPRFPGNEEGLKMQEEIRQKSKFEQGINKLKQDFEDAHKQKEKAIQLKKQRRKEAAIARFRERERLKQEETLAMIKNKESLSKLQSSIKDPNHTVSFAVDDPAGKVVVDGSTRLPDASVALTNGSPEKEREVPGHNQSDILPSMDKKQTLRRSRSFLNRSQFTKSTPFLKNRQNEVVTKNVSADGLTFIEGKGGMIKYFDNQKFYMKHYAPIVKEKKVDIKIEDINVQLKNIHERLRKVDMHFKKAKRGFKRQKSTVK